MLCPSCGSEMWDNTVNKKNPKGPDFKCKNKDCIDEKTGMVTAIWLKKEPGVKKVLVETNTTHPVNGELKEKTMLMSYAKDIVVALISRDQIIGEVGKEVVAIYNTLLEGLTHPLGKV